MPKFYSFNSANRLTGFVGMSDDTLEKKGAPQSVPGEVTIVRYDAGLPDTARLLDPVANVVRHTKMELMDEDADGNPVYSEVLDETKEPIAL